MDYSVIDVETANSDQGSICQIGIVFVRDDKITAQKSFYINPQDEFERPYHSDKHGITAETVKNAPLLPDVLTKLGALMSPNPVLHHGSFDKIAVNKACEKYNMPEFDFIWVDTTSLSRYFLPDSKDIGYSLKKLSKHFNIALNHHDALSDALAAQQIAEIIFKSNTKSDAEWLGYFKNPSKKKKTNYPKRLPPNQPGNINGKYHGGHIVFTGALQNLDRHEAATAAQNMGFSTGDTLIQKTTVLCVSDEQLEKGATTGKLKKAKELQSRGFPIQIISESDFMHMTKN